MTNANEHFGAHNGSETFYRHSISKIIYTDGVNEMAENCNAYWLIDLIASHQLYANVKLEEFQVWKLCRVKNNAFKIVCTNGNKIVITQQSIPFSDFAFDEATLWLVNGCLMLPCEY